MADIEIAVMSFWLSVAATVVSLVLGPITLGFVGAFSELTLAMKGATCTLDLGRPFELLEGSATGPGNSHLQVVTFRQDGIAWGFSYGLPITRKPYVSHDVNGYLTPSLAGETRLIHERVRARAFSRLRIPS